MLDCAKSAGRLRVDFEPTDPAPLVSAMAQLIRESTPDTWRRHRAFFRDGLRA
ncbi:hypothetical protein ABZU76_32720 [Amycolatopsis sp. NPDC005232]|uniref:hypothetical protein n=1 Tax=Amycolatopsis sp. NPDC005232 TaxID=3157027 RepID=UPI0033BD5D87